MNKVYGNSVNNLSWKSSIPELDVLDLFLLVVFGRVFGGSEKVSLEHFLNCVLSFLLEVLELNLNLIYNCLERVRLVFGQIREYFSVQLNVRSVETTNEVRILYVEVSGCWVDCRDPLFSDISSSEFSANVGLLKTFLDPGDGNSEAVFGSSIKAFCEFDVFLSWKPCHF